MLRQISLDPRRAAVTACATLAAAAASAAPLDLLPDATVTVPTYTGTTVPKVTSIQVNPLQTATLSGGAGSVTFNELAVQTNLNPAGETFVFWLTEVGAVGNVNVQLSGFGGYTTAVEACDPFTLTTSGCGVSPGTAARDAAGNVTFNNVGVAAPALNPAAANFITSSLVASGGVSDVYAIFTNAAGTVDPTACVNQLTGAGSACFSSLGPAGGVQGGGNAVPEPPTVALLGLGVAGLLLRRRR